ncbi:MAG: helix-turn-helix transcriptional regulator [Candidatus Omnitrophica bacterium]|nr:helix-turn-helix transcriptional regulator [Candidatus Omnitrophota bacterium]MBU1047604.1 helix-turn-helix transcriptional regulator [Candidatus Omnitrophota bacterium]MBU1631488.1 helix-turn-helix transcriptional regulator [Candidatus Omnitrophota bacterium]MBU1767238.1 helix-turn-helix transcriptional regulator [Candidatus Omnitrophota bacterium]MBU1888966.1 helix-turn-helix transcriptional regulator [Candidatus Omnitrophota bacterium]
MVNKNKEKTLFEKKMLNKKFRQRFKKEYPAFELEVQILNALERKGWTYSKLAEVMGTSKSNISRDLGANGIWSATISRLARMAEVLDADFVPLFIPRSKESEVLSKIQKIIVK